MKKNALLDNTKTIGLAIVCAALLYLSLSNPSLQEICSGVAIFLFGMIFLEDGFKGFSGGIMEKILARWTSSRFKAISFGVISTIIMQSSTLVTIISISFLSAGLISLAQAIGIVFGANLGTTTGGWIIAGIGMKMDIAKLGMPLIIISIVLIFQKDKNIKSLGYIFSGIGFFFLGIAYIKSGFEGYSSVLNLSQYAKGGALDMAIFIIVGVLITSIVQSSFATLTIIISALAAGSITYDNALGLVIGTNIGGVVTALVASFSANIEGKKLAITNTIFNFIIAAVCILLLDYFKLIVEWLAAIFGISDTDYALKIALFHTFYNVVAVALMSPYISSFVSLANRYIKANKNAATAHPLFLDDTLAKYPNTAAEALEDEQKHLYSNAFILFAHALGFHASDLKGDAPLRVLSAKKWYEYEVDVAQNYRDKIRVLFDAILSFGVKAQLENDEPEVAERIEKVSQNSRHALEATKNLMLAAPNLKKFSNSKNADIARIYNDMRENLGEILRIQAHLMGADSSADRKSVAKICAALKKHMDYFVKIDEGAVKSVEKLVKTGKVDVNSATSLINDIGFLRNVAELFGMGIAEIYGISLRDALSGNLEQDS